MENEAAPQVQGAPLQGQIIIDVAPKEGNQASLSIHFSGIPGSWAQVHEILCGVLRTVGYKMAPPEAQKQPLIEVPRVQVRPARPR